MYRQNHNSRYCDVSYKDNVIAPCKDVQWKFYHTRCVMKCTWQILCYITYWTPCIESFINVVCSLMLKMLSVILLIRSLHVISGLLIANELKYNTMIQNFTLLCAAAFELVFSMFKCCCCHYWWLDNESYIFHTSFSNMKRDWILHTSYQMLQVMLFVWYWIQILA